MARLAYYGHSAFMATTSDGTRIMIDPFLDDNPSSPVGRDHFSSLDYILCTHGHEDHFGDVAPLAKSTGARVVSSFEICAFLQGQGIERVCPMGVGGSVRLSFGRVKMTPAIHGGLVFGDESGQYTSTPAGFLLEVDGVRLHHAGDTALAMDMQLLRGAVDVAILPIGDTFTMGPQDAARAVDFIRPKTAIPMHYGTWPPIEQDPERFRELVGERAEVKIMAPGDELAL